MCLFLMISEPGVFAHIRQLFLVPSGEQPVQVVENSSPPLSDLEQV